MTIPVGAGRNGHLTFETHVSQLTFAKIESLTAARPGLDGVLEAELSGALRIANGIARPERLSGRMTAEKVTLDGEALGRAEVLLRPETGKSAFELNALLEGTRVIGFGTVGYDGDYPLEAKLAVPRLPLRLIRTLASAPAQGAAARASARAGIHRR